jgi:DNA repair exonuclease SbcCD ATPase subunit
MIAAMTAPVPQIVWSYRRPFLWVMSVTFIVLAVAAFTLPSQLTDVRSSIDVGSVTINENQESIEPLYETLRRIARIYGPMALSELTKKGTPPSTITALRASEIENIGLSVMAVSTVDKDAENEAKEYQQSIADQIIKDQAPRAQAVRERLAERINLAQKAAGTLEQQIDADVKEVERIDAVSENLRNQIDRLQTDVTKLDRGTGVGRPNEGSTNDAPVHAHELISNQITLIAKMTLIANLTLERSRLTQDLETLRSRYDARISSIAQAQSEAKTIAEARVSLPPFSLPLATGSRRLRLLFVAFVSSILIAFGTVVLLHNLAEDRN